MTGLRTCDHHDFVVFVYEKFLLNNDEDQMMNTYFDRHVMMTKVAKLEEEMMVVVIVALNMDHHMSDNKLNLDKQLNVEDNMVDRNLVFVNDSSMISEHYF